jgi:hypothetical protein
MRRGNNPKLALVMAKVWNDGRKAGINAAETENPFE